MSEELNTQNQTEVEPDQTTDNTETAPPAVEEAATKTFTQDEVNDLIAKRLEREKKKFADYDDIKTKASEYEKALEEKRLAELSEKERLEEIAKKHEEEKQSYAKELEALRENIKAEKIRNEFIKVATSNNIGYLDDAFNLADLSAVKVDEDGTVIGIEDVVKSLVDNKPFLVAKKVPKPIGESTNGAEKNTDKTADQLLKEAAEKYKRSGKIEDMAAYSKLKRDLGL